MWNKSDQDIEDEVFQMLDYIERGNPMVAVSRYTDLYVSTSYESLEKIREKLKELSGVFNLTLPKMLLDFWKKTVN